MSSITTTASTRRDGRTAATVPDHEAKGRLIALWRRHEQGGMPGPSTKEACREAGIGSWRLTRLLAELRAAGALPPLESVHTRRGDGGPEEHRARAAAIRAEATARPKGRAGGHRQMVRECLRREGSIRRWAFEWATVHGEPGID